MYRGQMFADGQEISIADLQWPAGWVKVKATVTKDAGEDRFHVVKENGVTLWGVNAEEIQCQIDSCDALCGKLVN